ncbi:MAG: hypothetical protein QM490_05130 [Candidatus Gracilibacteria bacterium]
MNKTFFTLLLIISLIIGVFHHIIISLTHANDYHIQELNNEIHSYFNIAFKDNIEKKSYHKHQNINHEIHPSSESEYSMSRSSILKKIKIGKILSNLGITNLVFNDFGFLENKNLIKKNSPPYLKRNIKNYSYSKLIKIIKSNT